MVRGRLVRVLGVMLSSLLELVLMLMLLCTHCDVGVLVEDAYDAGGDFASVMDDGFVVTFFHD